MAVKRFTDATFDTEVIASALPTLVDFTATWCGPCKQLAPVVEALAMELDGKVQFGKIDVDESPAIAARFGIRSVPTLLFFKGGELVDRHIGVTGKNHLSERLKSLFELTV